MSSPAQRPRPSADVRGVEQANGRRAVVELGVPPAVLEVIAERVADLLADRLGAGGPEPWIGVDEAARHLACSPKRIYDLKARGLVPHRKDGTRVLFRRSDLDAYLEGST